MKVIEILRLTADGYTQRQIAGSVKCAKSTVGEVQQRCRIAGITYQDAVSMPNDQLKARLYPASAQHKSMKEEPDWEEIHRRLKAHKRLNLQYLYETEYREQPVNHLSYSQFCRRYTLWQNQTGKHVVMVQEHEPGRELFVDWMGDTLPCVVWTATGEMRAAHFFVATLGDSGYPYVEAFPDEKLDKWLLAHVHAMEWIGGVPRVIVPDNTKTAVKKPQYYDPVLNPAYCELARYYDVAVLPARIRKPRDKAPVEGEISWLETWLLEWLRDQRFFGFETLNAEIRKRLLTLIDRPFQKRPGSRRSVFSEIDQPALRPLPQVPYEYAEYTYPRVPDNYHVPAGDFYYSVHYTLYNQRVMVRMTAKTVEIFNDNRERVAMHQRRYTGKRHVTCDEHMPAHHRFQREKNRYDGTRYREWAKTIGEYTHTVIDTMLKAQRLEETAYRSCMGVLQCARRYGPDRLELACRRACQLHACTYITVKNILKNSQETVTTNSIEEKPTPLHENLRGPKFYM